MKKLLLATTLLAGMSTMNSQAAWYDSIVNTVVSEADKTFATDAELQAYTTGVESALADLTSRIEQVDDEDQRVVSGTVEGDYLVLTTQDFDKDINSNKEVKILISSLDQSKDVETNTTAITTETAEREEADLGLGSRITLNTELITTNYNKQVDRDTAQDVRMDGMDAFVQEQQLYNTSFSNSINSNTSRINSLENKTEELTKGVAMAGAFAMGAGMHTLDHDNRWVIMPSLAHYEGETALAVQLQVAFTDHLSARFGYANSVSDMKDFDKGLVGGAVALSF